MRASRALRRMPADVARLADSLLDFLVLGLAAWTVVYHVFLVLDVGAAPAAAVWAAALVACGWLAFRREDDAPEPAAPARASRQWPRRYAAAGLALHAAAALAAAALFAWTSPGWWTLWPLLAAVAAGTLALTTARAAGRVSLAPAGEPRPRGERTWPEVLLVLGWTVALAVLSLYLVRPDADDAYYARLSSWIAEHGSFPLRDALFSDEVFPAIIYPPLSSFEALVGTAGYLTDVSTASLLYLVVTPLASGLAALAAWRLLRTWGARLAWLALSTAFVFLLMDADTHRSFGNLFVGRIWQGKIAFLAVLVPLLFALYGDYLARPSGRRLLLVAAVGAAGVGLTSTAAFLVPVVAAGCFVPAALRAPRIAAIGLAAAAAYPLGTLAATAAAGSRRAGGDLVSDVVAGQLVRFVLGDGSFAFLAMAALLLGPVLVPAGRLAQTAAGAVLLVILLYAPPVPQLIWELTGIGQVLWRLTWAAPAAILLGILTTSLLARVPWPGVGALPALALIGVLAAWGYPVWSVARVADEPSWKRPRASIPAARRILAAAEPGDVVLAPRQVSQTILVLSGSVTTVAPRIFYAAALRDVPGAHARERVLLETFIDPQERRPALVTGEITDADVARALRVVGVDIACVKAGDRGALRAVRDAGYTPLFRNDAVACTQAPGSG